MEKLEIAWFQGWAIDIAKDNGIRVENEGNPVVILHGKKEQIQNTLHSVLDKSIKWRNPNIPGEWEHYTEYDNGICGLLIGRNGTNWKDLCQEYNIVFYVNKKVYGCWMKGTDSDKNEFKTYLKYNSLNSKYKYNDKELIKFEKSDELQEHIFTILQKLKEKTEGTSNRICTIEFQTGRKTDESSVNDCVETRFENNIKLYCMEPELILWCRVYSDKDQNIIDYEDNKAKPLTYFLRPNIEDEEGKEVIEEVERNDDDDSKTDKKKVGDGEKGDEEEGDEEEGDEEETNKTKRVAPIYICQRYRNKVTFINTSPKNLKTVVHFKCQKLNDEIEDHIRHHVQKLKKPFFDKLRMENGKLRMEDEGLTLAKALPDGYWLANYSSDKISVQDCLSTGNVSQFSEDNEVITGKVNSHWVFNKGLNEMLDGNDWKEDEVTKKFMKIFPSMEGV